jgi:unspecific monooxygenase
MLKDVVLLLLQLIEQNRATVLCVLASFYLAYQLVIYPFFVSPLRKIPGPYMFRISKLPALHYQRTNQWVFLVHELHKQYGDVVILSPNEISLNGNPQYLNDLYTKNFPKLTFYENFRNHGHRDNMFSSLENERHINYKKNVTGIYLKSAVFNPKNTTRLAILEKVAKLVKQIKESSVEGIRPDYLNAALDVNVHGKGHNAVDKLWFLDGGKHKNLGIDVYSLFGSLALDVVTSFELGPENSTNLLDVPEKRSIITYHRYVASMVFYTTLAPKFWNYAASALIKKSSEIVENWQLSIYENAENNVPKFGKDQNLTTLELLKKNKLYGKNAYSFLSDNIFAGHDTTAIQLTYLTYELSRPMHHYLQTLMKQELDTAFSTPKSDEDLITDFETVDNLPILNSIILETSRVHASIPGAEPRVVDRNYKIMGTVIPKGTIVSTQPYSMHRVESVFPKADYFIPERWLKKESETEQEFASRIKLQNKYMIPFGKGVRMCLGMNIAQIEMKLAIANIYWHFNSKICENWCEIVQYDDSVKHPNPIKMGDKFVGDKTTDEQKMVMFDTYTTRPYDDECWLEFYRN